MANKNWKKNSAIHEVDLAFAGNSTESVKYAAVTPDGKSAGFTGGPPVQSGDPENKAGQAYAQALFDGSALPGIDVSTGWGRNTKHSGEFADADRPHVERHNRYGAAAPRYGFGVADRKGLKGR